MKISRNWLQKYFNSELPEAQGIADALTFHAFEIESAETVGDDAILDVKITPNRGHDCLSYRGIAKELSAILMLPMKQDPYRLPVFLAPATKLFSVRIDNPHLCKRFTGCFIAGVKVGPSPEWLQRALEKMGQKSINNVVDATNYIMFDLGQPLHAFDAGKLAAKDGTYALTVRSATEGEKMVGLDEKEYTLTSSMLAIEDAHAGHAVSIAGIKGGLPTGIDETTVNVVLEAANWDGATIRKTSSALKLRTDASDRFQQALSPETTSIGLKAAAELIVELAGGVVEGYLDEYPTQQEKWTVSVIAQKVNSVLGTSLEKSNIVEAFKRLDLSHEEQGDLFIVHVPFERLDLVSREDLIEEISRLVGYDKIPAQSLPRFEKKPEINRHFAAAEKKREELMAEGYAEVYTSVFADTGERIVANKVDGVRPYLRSSLLPGLEEALERNVRNKDLLGLSEVKLFEIGTIWKGSKEEIVVGTISEKGKAEEASLEDAATSTYQDYPISTTERYATFSKYPYIVRDIALWTDGDEKDVLASIQKSAGELLIRAEKFDEFKKGDRTSFAFHLVFQSFEKTLTDDEANAAMEKVYAAVKDRGWEVR